MKLSDLKIFCAVIDNGTVTRAAVRLHRVQSNVTTRIKQLERDLDVALFVREGRRLRLSAAGQILDGYARRLLLLAEQARVAVQDQSPRGVLRLGAMDSAAAVRLPEPLTCYLDHYPDVELELTTANPGQLVAGIHAGELDAAFVAEPFATPGLDSMAAFEERVVIATPTQRPLINEDGRLPNTIIVFEHGCPHRQLLESMYADRGESPARIIEMASYHGMLGCVLAGMGVALLPASLLGTFPESQRLTIHSLPSGNDLLPTRLVWRAGTVSPNVNALRNIVSTVCTGGGDPPATKSAQSLL